ncbi:aspartate dehydrogenase [Methanococcus maripaludis]|uniref:L-aspartate dehydrogenase n=1 Tax=Methanococcus maripaludis TaxID=39152 RepID=A0A7J9P573_METMI|nr:aspartate dehydrogenase [Methanococcus maripaludis]MBA2858355.1 aspartate dehydrogenase [Methanococcus maripaludis]
MLKIGLVGCGAIASLITKALMSDRLNKAEVLAFYDGNLEKAEKLAMETGADFCKSLDELVSKDLDLIVECASVNAVEDTVIKSLNNDKDVIIMSVGAFADKDLFVKLYKLAEKLGKKIYIPSGAVAGIDAVKSGSLGKISEVSLTTTKPVHGLKSALEEQGLNTDEIKEPKIVFEGTVFDAISKFPQNINVSVVLSLASRYPAKVKIIADPNAVVNRHEILVKGSIGTIKTCVENNPCRDNPKTSALAAYSVIRLIKDLSEPVRIGT